MMDFSLLCSQTSRMFLREPVFYTTSHRQSIRPSIRSVSSIFIRLLLPVRMTGTTEPVEAENPSHVSERHRKGLRFVVSSIRFSRSKSEVRFHDICGPLPKHDCITKATPQIPHAMYFNQFNPHTCTTRFRHPCPRTCSPACHQCKAPKLQVAQNDPARSACLIADHAPSLRTRTSTHF